MDDGWSDEELARAQASAREVLKKVPSLIAAQKAAELHNREVATAAASTISARLAPLLANTARALSAYGNFVQENRDTTGNLLRGLSIASDTITKQVQQNPDLAASMIRVARAQDQFKRQRVAQDSSSQAAQPDESGKQTGLEQDLREYAEALAEDDDFADLIDNASAHIDVADADQHNLEKLYGLGVEPETVKTFLAIYLALQVALFLANHQMIEVALDKVTDTFEYAGWIYVALKARRARKDE